MNRILIFIMFTCGLSVCAHADIWKYVDDQGKSHFVESNESIYTWLDDSGKRHYADMPGHETAVAVQLVWHSRGSLADLAPAGGTAQPEAGASDQGYPGETQAEREKREAAEAYYCERAQQIYDSYVNAPRLYKTDDNGTRVFLSDEEAETTLAETKVRVDELCN